MTYSEGAESLKPEGGGAVQMHRESGATPTAQSAQPGEPGAIVQRDAQSGSEAQPGTQEQPQVEVRVPPHVPQPYRDPTRDPTFRQRTLRWASGQISRIRELMSYGVFDWAITDSEATQALQILHEMPTSNRMVVAQELATTNAGARLYENVPDGARNSYPTAFLTIAVVTNHADYIQQVIRFPPRYIDASKDHALMVRVMSMVTEADMRAAADRVQNPGQADNAPLKQWISKSPEPPKGDMTRRFSEAVTFAQQAHAAQATRTREQAETSRATDAEMRNNPAFRRTIQTIEGLLSYGVFDWAITDAEARQVFGIFGRMGSRQEVAMAVNQLDRGPFMDRFLDNLPPADRWGSRKGTFLRIISARTPEKNVRFVQQLLSYGIFDWAINSEEAHMAYQIVKTMPADVQRTFQDAQNGQWWQRMEGNLAQEQTNDRDLNLYANEGQKGQRKAEFEQQCASWDRGRLQSMLEMLCRMGEDRFVEDTLRSKGLLGQQANAWIGQTYGFLRDRRDDTIYQAWLQNRSTDRQAPGFFQQVGGALGTIGSAIDYGVTGDANFDLEQAQSMLGGDIHNPIGGGADGMHMTLAARQRGDDRSNRLSVATDSDRGRHKLTGQQINIAHFSNVADGTTIQAGPIVVRGIDIDFKWPTARDPSSSLKISIPGIAARDIAIMSRDAMWTVGSLTVTGLLIEARTPPGTAPASEDQAKSLLMGEVQRAVQRLLGMVRGANVQPDQLASQLTGSFSELQASVRIDNIVAERVGGSDGTYVERAEVKNAAITVSNSRKGETIRTRLAQLARDAATRPLSAEETNERQRLETAKAQVEALEAEETNERGRLETAKAQVEALEAEERRLAALEANRRITPPDRDRLAEIRSELTITRATVTVDELSVRNVNAAGVHADSARLGNIRASVSGEQQTGNGRVNDARVSASVGTLEAHGVSAGGVQIGDVSGSDIHAEATTNAQGTRANVHIGALDATGGQGGQAGAQAGVGGVHVRGLDVGVSGGANLLTAGTDLHGQEIGLDLSLANLSLNNMNFAGSGMQLEAGSAALSGFRVNARVRVERKPEGGFKVVPVALGHLELDRLNATGLHAVLPVGGESVDLRVPSAAVVNLRIRDVPLTDFNPVSLAGNMSVDSIQTEMNAKIGDYFAAQGRLNVSDLRAEALSTGAVHMHLGDLTLENLGFTATGDVPPDSIVAKLRGAHAQINRLGGIRGDATIDRQSGAIEFEAGIGDFNMANVGYQGGGMRLAVDGGVKMTGATIRGSAQVNPAALTGGAPQGVSPLQSLRIAELRVAKIEGSGIHYANPAGGQSIDLQRGYLEDIRVQNMDALAGTGDFHLGAAGVQNLNLAMTQGLQGEGGRRIIRANASARITGVNASRANNGRMTFSIAGVSGQASGSMRQTDANGATTADVRGNASANVSGISGTVGADGGVTARAQSAGLDAHVSGTAGGNEVDVNASVRAQGISGGRGANGDVNAHLGSGSASVRGRVGGPDGGGAFNLDLSNLGADVSVTSTGFAASVNVGSISLGNTNFSGGGKQITLGRGGQLSGLRVRVSARTGARGIESVSIGEIAATRLQVNDARVRWGDYELNLPHGHIDGINVTGLNLVAGKDGLVPTGGSVRVGQIAVDRLQANIGRDLSAHAGRFAASGLELDLLGTDAYSFRLADIEARAVGARTPNGQAELEWLNAHGISFQGGAGGGTARVGSANFGLGGSGQSNGATIGPRDAQAATNVRSRWELPFLDSLGGQVGLDIPIGSDRVSGALVVQAGRARLGPTLSSIHLPHEQYWGWAPGWLVKRMIGEAAGYMVDYFNPEFARLRGRVEGWLASDGSARPGAPGFELNAQAISTSLVNKMGGWSAVLDVASPTGPGILRTAGDAVATWLTEHDPLGLYPSDAAAQESARQMRESAKQRRVQELVDWIRGIALDIALAGDGAVRGFQTAPSQAEKQWLTAQAHADLTARGTLASQIRLAMRAGMSGVSLDLGSLQVTADRANIDASGGAALSGGGTASGDGRMTGSASGITLRVVR